MNNSRHSSVGNRQIIVDRRFWAERQNMRELVRVVKKRERAALLASRCATKDDP
jgi:hypothetical protein